MSCVSTDIVRPTYRITRDISILRIAVGMTIRIWAPPEESDPCGLLNSQLFHHGADSGAIKQRMLAPVLLQDLPCYRQRLAAISVGSIPSLTRCAHVRRR
jgi:hypothetical protein